MKTLYKIIFSFLSFPFYNNSTGATVIIAKEALEKTVHFNTSANNVIEINYKAPPGFETPIVNIEDNDHLSSVSVKNKMIINRTNKENVMANVKIFDSYGRKVSENDLNIQNGTGSMDLSNLPQGRYYLQVICELEACSIPFTKL